MKLPFPGLGIVFDIEGLGGGFYGFRAWQIFTKNLDARKLGHFCVLVDGDTAATLAGRSNEYCIGIYGSEDTISYVRNIFEDLDEPGIATFHRRFIEKIALDNEPLPIRGQLDFGHRLVTDEWNGMDHEICKGSGWGYYPKKISISLEAVRLAELEEMKQPRL